jgi:hypothetical protein
VVISVAAVRMVIMSKAFPRKSRGAGPVKSVLRVVGIVGVFMALLFIFIGLTSFAAETHEGMDRACGLVYEPPAPLRDEGSLTGEMGWWPYGPRCSFILEDGSTAVVTEDDWSATWFLYGGLALGVLSLASLIGSSATRRPDAAVRWHCG